MSIRDFITRQSLLVTAAVRNTTITLVPDIVIETAPDIVLEPAPDIVIEPSPYIPVDGAEPFYFDIESRSVAQLGKGKHGVGARAYAGHDTTEVLCVAFARGDRPFEIWIPPQPVPETVLAAAADPNCPWVAHHALFDRAMLEEILVPRHGWPAVPVERFVCTMILALSHSHPGSLEDAAAALGLQQQKDVAAKRAIAKMFRPRKPRQDEDPNDLYWVDTAELRTLLYRYARQDVAVMRGVHRHLTPLPETEREIALIDAEINDRGVLIDAPLARAASRLASRALNELDARIKKVTAGHVSAASQVAKLKAWLVSQGLKLPRKPHKSGEGGLQWKDSLDGDDIEKLLAGELPNSKVRKALDIRLQAAQSAASKVDRMLHTRCADGRVRNMYRMYGTVTGRWTGEGLQPQNLKRPVLLKDDEAIAAAIEMVLAGNYTGIKKDYGNVLGVIGDLCRSMLIPASGCRFIVGDFSAIEARVLTWLAGDTDKLTRFADSDYGRGRELYCETAEQVLGLKHEVTSKSPERALGKIFELGLGYQMGGERLLSTIRKANIPGIDIDIKRAEVWVRKWRQQNPKIVEFWAALDVTAKTALRHPGTVVDCGAVQLQMRSGVLYLRLPYGRELKYQGPVIKPGRFGHRQVTCLDTEAGRQRHKQMYGGRWAENVTSAAARDLLVEAMRRLRAAAYSLVMTTHDEIVAEMPIGRGSIEEFKNLLIEAPAWAQGMPIAAKVFECARFKKD